MLKQIVFQHYTKTDFRPLTDWSYRNFGDQAVAIKVVSGKVDNIMRNYPAESAVDVNNVNVAIQQVFLKNFRFWVDIYVK